MSRTYHFCSFSEELSRARRCAYPLFNSLEEAMEITHPREYKSPRRKLVRFFEKSRDKWKLKYREVKKVLKRLTNRIRFLERSKAEYKQRVEELQAQLAALKASRLEARRGERGVKKR
jgi:predicted RNase H-like nuclease (RuvC/YqgF family)